MNAPAELRDVVGYEGVYAVTADGRVWAHPRRWTTGRDGGIQRSHGGRWMRVFVAPSGYVRVNLKRDGKARSVNVHRIVAEAWIANPDGLPQVNHRNAIKADNRVENLEWCTASENKRHAVAAGLCPPTEAFLASVRRNVLKAHAATRTKSRRSKGAAE